MTIKLSRKYVVICIQGVDEIKVYYLIKSRFSSRGKVTLRSILQSIKAQDRHRLACLCLFFPFLRATEKEQKSCKKCAEQTEESGPKTESDHPECVCVSWAVDANLALLRARHVE